MTNERERIEHANEIIAVISRYGNRRFLHESGVSRFGLDDHDKPWWMDAGTGKVIYVDNPVWNLEAYSGDEPRLWEGPLSDAGFSEADSQAAVYLIALLGIVYIGRGRKINCCFIAKRTGCHNCSPELWQSRKDLDAVRAALKNNPAILFEKQWGDPD